MERVYSENGIQFVERGEETAAIQERMEGEEAVLSLRGVISGETANVLLDEMTAFTVAGKGVTVELDQVSYLAVSVMDVFLQMERRLEKKGKYLKLTQMPQEIYQEFKARGMHELLEIEVKNK